LIYCFDVDGTICTLTEDFGYEYAQPIDEMVDKVNRLYDEGHTIKIHTARGQTSGIDWEAFTIEQLKEWGVKFHEFYYGKPSADFYIDDKGINVKDFLAGRMI
jgi:carbamoyl-phosphate synthase large subunit